MYQYMYKVPLPPTTLLGGLINAIYACLGFNADLMVVFIICLVLFLSYRLFLCTHQRLVTNKQLTAVVHGIRETLYINKSKVW